MLNRNAIVIARAAQAHAWAMRACEGVKSMIRR